jgi:hypothetical protein
MSDINKILDDIDNNTDRIAGMFLNESNLNLEDIKTLSGLYDKRQKSLDALEKWYGTSEAKKYIKLNKEHFDKRISSIIDKDKSQLFNIEGKVKELKSKLRKINKQKSVLIYTKEK